MRNFSKLAMVSIKQANDMVKEKGLGFVSTIELLLTSAGNSFVVSDVLSDLKVDLGVGLSGSDKWPEEGKAVEYFDNLSEFSESARMVLALALEQADHLGRKEVLPVHVVLALLQDLPRSYYGECYSRAQYWLRGIIRLSFKEFENLILRKMIATMARPSPRAKQGERDKRVVFTYPY